jgi:outer membrane lipase/esterase
VIKPKDRNSQTFPRQKKLTELTINMANPPHFCKYTSSTMQFILSAQEFAMIEAKDIDPARYKFGPARVVAFGDSLTDGGTFAAITRTGRFTTPGGRIWSEWVAEAFGTELLPAAIYRDGQFHNKEGWNYAQSGARVHSNQGLHDGLSLSLERQIDIYLQREQPTRHHVFLISIGGPDLLVEAMAIQQGMQAPAQALEHLRDVVLAYVSQVTRLTKAGATRVAMVNVADFGLTPVFGAGQGPAAALATQLSHAFNTDLANRVPSLGLEVLLIDAAYAFGEMAKNPSNYGLVNVTEQALDPVRTPPSATGTSANGSVEHLVAPDAGETYLFADFVHPTGAAHRIFGTFALKQIATRWKN